MRANSHHRLSVSEKIGSLVYALLIRSMCAFTAFSIFSASASSFASCSSSSEFEETWTHKMRKTLHLGASFGSFSKGSRALEDCFAHSSLRESDFSAPRKPLRVCFKVCLWFVSGLLLCLEC